MNKRGMSQIVISVLLILLVLVAVALVFFAVRPLLKSIGEETNIGQFTASYRIESAGFNGTDASLRVRRMAGSGNVSALNIILTDISGNSEVVRSNILIQELETKTFSVPYQGLGNLTEIAVAPIFLVNGKEKIGSIVDTYRFQGSGPLDPLGGSGVCGNNILESGEECDDGNTNDGDGCSSICLLEQGFHNFEFLLNPSDGYLQELNWSSDGGNNWERISWSEQGRFTQWRKHYLHSTIGGGGDTQNRGWKYLNSVGWPPQDESLFTEETHSAITYTLLNSDEDGYSIRAETPNFRVTDDITFTGDYIYIDIQIENKRNNALTFRLPVQIGGLELISGTKFELTGEKGGWIRSFVRTVEEGNPQTYPKKIQTFSPVNAIWDNGFTIGQQYMISGLTLPDTIDFHQVATDRNRAKIKSIVNVELEPLETKNIRVVFGVADGARNWELTLQPYKNWFNLEYGGGDGVNDPSYCPTSAYAFYMSRNSNRFDPATLRWDPGTTLTQIYQNTASIPVALNLGLKTFLFHSGVSVHGWNLNLTQFPSDWNGYNDAGFNPTYDLIDPNIDAGRDKIHLNNFFANYNNAGITPIWYGRTCAEIYGADVLLHDNGDGDWTIGEDYTFVRGTPSLQRGNDLRNPINSEKAYSRIADAVDRGAKGFYIDVGTCAGEDEYLDWMESRILNEKGVRLVNYEEGARDRSALKRPQIPIFIGGDVDHSNLLFWLVPDASYYRGRWGAGTDELSDSEIYDILDLGYQPVVDNSLNNLNSGNVTLIQDWVCLAYQNELDRWNSYGQGIGCAMPQEPSHC